jgi:pimeloyl-ACP methyl ester carboxylesterase
LVTHPFAALQKNEEVTMARKAWTFTAAALAASGLFVAVETRRAKRRWPPIGRFINVDGVRLHYVQRGTGQPLVLLHGNGSLIQDFLLSGFVRRASRRHGVIVFDRPGYGWSQRPRDRVWTPAAQAALLRKAAQALGTERVHLLGHSWGSLVAAEWALQDPESVASLTLVGGYFFPTARLDALLISGNAVPVLGTVMRAAVTPVLARLIWPLILRALFRPAPVPQEFRRFPRGFALSPRSLRAAAEEAAMLVPSAARLASRYADLRVPVSIVAGEGDGIVDSQEQSLRLHQALLGSRISLVPAVGHMVHHSAPDAVLRALSEEMAQAE